MTFPSRRSLLILLIGFLVVLCSCARLPRKVVVSEASSALIPSPPSTGRLNINTASAAELEQLPGIGTGLAERIVAHRKQHGPFGRPEHLMMVRGISERKFRQVRPLISTL